MKHYSEEEILMCCLEAEAPEWDRPSGLHLRQCRECRAVLAEFQALNACVREWELPEVEAAEWESRKAALFARLRGEERLGRPFAWLDWEWLSIRRIWDYALEHPLPALGYISAAIAFASERTITIFRLDQLLPGTGELIALISQVF